MGISASGQRVMMRGVLVLVAGLLVGCQAMKVGSDGGGKGILPEEPYQLGVAHVLNDELETAILYFDEAIARDPNFEPAYAERGRAHLQLENWDQAIADLSRLIELGVISATVYNDRGQAYEASGVEENALADYGRAIEIAPGFALPYLNRARLRMQQGELASALVDYGKALECEMEPVVRENTISMLEDLASVEQDPTIGVQLERLLNDAGQTR
jgi:tetratricopeptide (TPR) repeat protein